MRCKQHPNCAFLQYLRHITSNRPSSHAPPDGLCSASRPAVLSLPVSRKLLGGRANKQDKQHSHRATPTRHRRLDRLDSLRRVHRRNSRLYRGNPGLHRTRTLRRRPHPQYYTSSHILRRRDRGHDIRILLCLDLRNLVGAWRLSRRSIRHRIPDRRRNLRTLRSPPYILPPEKQWSHATLDSLRNIDIPRGRQRVPPPIRQRGILDTILRHRSTPLHRLPRRHPSRTLRDSVLPGTRKNRSSRNTTTNETTRAWETTLVENFLKESYVVALTLFHQMCEVSFLASARSLKCPCSRQKGIISYVQSRKGLAGK